MKWTRKPDPDRPGWEILSYSTPFSGGILVVPEGTPFPDTIDSTGKPAWSKKSKPKKEKARKPEPSAGAKAKAAEALTRIGMTRKGKK